MSGEPVTRRYSVAEEIAHAITRGVDLLLSIAAPAILVVFASLRGNAWHIVSCHFVAVLFYVIPGTGP